MIIKMIIRSSQDEQPAYFYTKLLGFFFFFIEYNNQYLSVFTRALR